MKIAAIKMNCIGRGFSRIEGVRANVNVLQPYFFYQGPRQFAGL